MNKKTNKKITLKKSWLFSYKLALQQLDCVEDLIEKSKKQHIAYSKCQIDGGLPIPERIERAIQLLNAAYPCVKEFNVN